MKHFTKNKIGLYSVIFVCLFLIGYIIPEKEYSGDNYKRIDFYLPINNNIEVYESFSGVIKSDDITEIESHISGIVEELYLKEGQEISSNESIAKISHQIDIQSFERAKANYNLERNNFDLAFYEYEINLKLFNKGVIAKNEFVKVKNNYEKAKVRKLNANNELDIARKGYTGKKEDWVFIKSTAEGVIDELNIAKGASVFGKNQYRSGSIVAKIIGKGEFYIEFFVNEIDLEKIRLNDTLKISIPSLNTIIETTVNFVSQSGDKNEYTTLYKVTSEMDDENVKDRIRMNMSAKVDVLVGVSKGFLIYEKDILYKKDSTYIKYLDVTKNVLEKPIRTGVSDGILTEVVQGIKKGDKIIPIN